MYQFSLLRILLNKLQLKNQKDVIQDIELLSSQVERCNQILRRLSLNPDIEDNFIDDDFHFGRNVCILGMDIVVRLFPFEDPIS